MTRVGSPRGWRNVVRSLNCIYGCERPPLSALKDALKAWQEEVKLYSQLFRDDACYWYNERASVSTFAAAVVRSGGVILEEYHDKKRAQGSSGCSTNGRVDLWLQTKRGLRGKKKRFVAEAKMYWPPIQLSEDTGKMEERIDTILTFTLRKARKRRNNGPMRRAVDDVRRCVAERFEKRLGMVYMVPCIWAKSGRGIIDRVDAVVNMLAKKVCQAVYSGHFCGAALAFPKEARMLQNSDDGPYYPGVALLLKQV